MKYGATAVSVIALLWAAAMALRSTRLPWIVPAYVIFQLVFAASAFLGLQRSVVESRVYAQFYTLAFGSLLILPAFFLAVLLRHHDQVLRVWLVGAAMLFFAAVGATIYFEVLKIYKHVPAQEYIALAQGTALTVYGAIALTSLALRLEPETNIAATALGLFWLSIGVLSFAFAIGIARNQRVWLTLNDFLPAFLAIVAFGWMAFELGKRQHELSFQALPAVAQLERTVVSQ